MYKHILVPVHPGHGAVGERIISVARLLAGAEGRITLLTVIETIPGYIVNDIPADLLEASHNTVVDEVRALAERTGFDTAELAVRHGNPSTTILEAAEELGVDAIILGSHRPNFSDYLIGSTASRVVRHAQCTVVVERSGPAPS